MAWLDLLILMEMFLEKDKKSLRAPYVFSFPTGSLSSEINN